MTTDVLARPPFVRPEIVVAAAQEALTPPGELPWFLAPVQDGLALHTVVRRWARANEPQARRARLACGTALYAARLAVAVQGRRPVVTRPEEPGVVAVVRAGAEAAALPPVRAAYSVLRSGGRARAQVASRAATALLRRAAEAEGAWLRSVHLRRPGPDAVDLGPRWSETVGEAEDVEDAAHPTEAMLLGVDVIAPWGEVRAGQALEAVVLAAGAVGWATTVLAAPAAPDAIRDRAVFDRPDPLGRTGTTVVLALTDRFDPPGPDEEES